MSKKILFFLFCIFLLNTCYSENKKDTSSAKNDSLVTGISCDFVSRYVWRGQAYGSAPHIQPSFLLTYKNLEFGIWGSYNFTGSYCETDPYLKYTFKGLSIIAMDYFSHDETFSNYTKYSVYESKKTSHTIETALQYNGPENFPISILVASYVYGIDYGWGYDLKKDTTLENYYSTYFELGYSFSCKKNDFDVFLGFTPFACAFGNTAGVVNIGITGNHDIKITNEFSLPVKASVVYNPQFENLFFVFGITLE
ncbi:MAG: hypothetical protein PHD97_08165 [Bacteroidales bacterium]|nr:hypothetical protein [Bacteroidales bacterium]